MAGVGGELLARLPTKGVDREPATTARKAKALT